ncbi:MAG: HlyD family efflux transporter periplasmic adaptor subunit [Hyphomicrobium sp.]
MRETTALDISKRLVELLIVSCIAAVAATKATNFAGPPPPPPAIVHSEFAGVVRSAPVATEIKTLSTGRLVPIALFDGRAVKSGDLLARIEPEDQNLEIEALRLDLLAQSMQKSAVSAEKMGSATFAVGDDFLPDQNWSPQTIAVFDELTASLREVVDKQQRVNQMKQDAERRQFDRLARKSEMLAAIRSKCAEQLASLRTQRQRTAEMVARGTFPVNRDAELERQIMALEQRLVEADLQQADIDGETDAATLAAAELAKSRLEDLLTRERDLAVKIADIKARIAAHNDVTARSEIRAPHDGIIRNVRFASAGVKVLNGDALMDIEPPDQSYVVEVVAPAQDLPAIEAGDSAEVRTGLSKVSGSTAIRATVDGIVNDTNDTADPLSATRTVYLAIDDAAVSEKQRAKFRIGYSVSVTVRQPKAEAGSVTEFTPQPGKKRSDSG